MGRVQTFCKKLRKMTFRGGQDAQPFKTSDWALSKSMWKTSDVMGGGGEGGKQNVKMKLFSPKIVWTSPLSIIRIV